MKRSPMPRSTKPMSRTRKRTKVHPRPAPEPVCMPGKVDRRYLDWVATHDCCALVGMCDGDVVAHHYPSGHAKDDALTVPLCFEHHMNEYHQVGSLKPMTADDTHEYFKSVQLRLLLEWRDAG